MKKLVRWIPALIVMSLIFYFSSQQGVALAPTYFWNYLANKGAHLFWYFILCLSFYFATGNILYSILLTITFGISDEIHQGFVPNRTPRVSDVVIDSAAASFAGVVSYVFRKK